jgi:Fe-S-cluster containining protein
MRKLIELMAECNLPWIKEIQQIFEPLLNLLALDNESFSLKQNEFLSLQKSAKSFLRHPFHHWFRNLLKEAVIIDSLATYDTIRDLFLNRIALQAPNCLECPDEHGCCHGTYSIEPIDYDRIIANKLIDPSNLTQFYNKYKAKLVKDQNQQQYCSAFDISTKRCLIHQFKPPTCCKYPLITNIHEWSSEMMAWTGTCAHTDKIWATRVHPAVMNLLRELAVAAQFLWEKEQNIFYRLKNQQNPEIKGIISRILALNHANNSDKSMIIEKILMEDYPESSIQQTFKLMKQYKV